MGAHKQTAYQKYCHSEVSSSLTSCNNKPFLNQIWYAMESAFYMRTSDDQLSGWTEIKLQNTSQSQTCTKKKKKDHGHCLVVCCWSDPLQLSESRWNHYTWEVCSANRWDALKTAPPEDGSGQHKGPSSSPWQCLAVLCTTSASNLNELGYEVLPHLPYSLVLLPTDYHFFKRLNNFLHASTASRTQEMLSKSLSSPKAWIFMLQG